jgi:ABC-2 type transport system permease protein
LKRILIIFWREYWGNITRRSYLIFTFGFPIFMILTPLVGGIVLALAIWTALPPTDPRPIGVVDRAQLFANAGAPPDEPVEIIMFADMRAAVGALNEGQIQAIYTLPPDYWQSGQVIITYNTAPTEFVDAMFTGWVRTQLWAKAPPDMARRLEQGPTITHHGLAGQNSYAESDVIEPVLVYLALYFVRLAGAFTASYMFDSIASEANDRTLEILVTSVSPFQFLAGKLCGLLAVGLTQIGMWGGAIVVFAVGLSWWLNVDLLTFLLAWEHLGLMINVLIATYLLDQILAAAMGLLRVSGGAGNLLFSTVNSVIGISLIYAAYVVPRNPAAPLAVVASLFPLTSPLVLLIRVAVSDVPRWQIILSLWLLWGTNGLGVLWLRRLLKANLVAGSTSSSLKSWLKARWGSRQRLNSLGQKQ